MYMFWWCRKAIAPEGNPHKQREYVKIHKRPCPSWESNPGPLSHHTIKVFSELPHFTFLVVVLHLQVYALPYAQLWCVISTFSPVILSAHSISNSSHILSPQYCSHIGSIASVISKTVQLVLSIFVIPVSILKSQRIPCGISPLDWWLVMEYVQQHTFCYTHPVLWLCCMLLPPTSLDPAVVSIDCLWDLFAQSAPQGLSSAADPVRIDLFL